ncbi:hypothetical protein [Sediminibacterium sp.]|jgi:hypothetical protein|uniref:DUF6934 family protein n=1 Tax=Sediminibacterium sp. TaxID=1917865 RepID=UPI0025D42DE5|nr:hypothetical protein [Sediminibacterium sp.]MBW0176883.1 hypothetical protein [Sediminibacterium sp.]
MNNFENIYELKEDKSATGLKFFFISKGERDIIKAVQFSFIQELNGRNIYNLGFGDYDLENDTITDDINTNNGDAYKVLNTVLSTIPIFFENFSNDILLVQGSDGRPAFAENCRLVCKKNCIDECKNYNRRINIYRGYVDKNYEELIADYQFLGGSINEEQQIILQPYERYKKYDSVFLFRKNINFIL